MIHSRYSDGGGSAPFVLATDRINTSFDDMSRRRLDALAVLGCLTARDRAIVSLIDEHLVLTSDQLARVFFPRLDVAQRRLLRLTHLTVLDRFRRRLLVGSESWHYALGPIGAAIAAGARDADPPSNSILRRRALRLAASSRLDHLVGINGWFCDLRAEALAIPGARLATWWSEQRCAEHYGQIVKPDGAGAFVEGGQRVDFFLEYDMGTEPLGRVVDKLTRYADLASAGGPKVPVLFWCQSAARERHLFQLLSKPRYDGSGRVTAAVSSAEMAAVLGVGVSGECWLPVGGEDRRRLIDVGPTGTNRRAGQS